jgi:outer membrane protein OmpA-like peptidoglycan-associated protein
MTRYLLTLLFVAITILGASAQSIQWASEVLEFSSELTPIQYSAQQVLGKPNVLPAGGENPGAWTPDRANKKDFIKVGFETPISIRQIAIAESYNPTAIFRVSVFDEQGTEYEINTFNPKPVPIKARVMNVFIERTPYKVAAVKIEFDGAAVPEYYSIDAIAISDSDIPIVATIDIPELLSSGLIIERLNENVNSEYKEFKPLLSPDGKVLYFSRKNHPENIGGVEDNEDIWYSEKNTETGEWEKAKNIGPTLNNAGPNFVSSVTPDGKTAVLLLGNRYLENGKMVAGVSMSNNKNGEWTEPTTIEIENDYNYSNRANYYLTNNRKVLLMSVDREDTQGGRDLYVSFMKDDSIWTEPLNIGKQVNTAGEESCPFLAADDKTLYFSSNGYSGFGGSDIYAAKRLDDTWTNWSIPENLGETINSDQEDLFFNIPVTSEHAYYSRGVSEDDADIYRIPLPIFVMPDRVIAVSGKLIDSKTGKPIEANIIYERLSDGKEIGIASSDPVTGEYEMLLPEGELYGWRAEADGYLSESQNIDLRNIEGDAKEITHKDLMLVALEKQAIVTLNNVFFDLEKATLRSESRPELDRLSGILKDRTSMTIVVAGHTDTTGLDEYNMNLSKMRATAVADYIINSGVSKVRVSVKFYGETQPAHSNNTREGRIKNRRVEFKVIND